MVVRDHQWIDAWISKYQLGIGELFYFGLKFDVTEIGVYEFVWFILFVQQFLLDWIGVFWEFWLVWLGCFVSRLRLVRLIVGRLTMTLGYISLIDI